MITVNKGQYIKCFLRNGMMLEGIVEESTGAQVVLRSINDQSLIIIHRPGEDIILTKIMLENPKEKISTPSVTQEKVKSKLHEAQDSVNEPELQKKTIKELQELVIEQDKQMIINKTKEHFGSPGAAKSASYTSPFIKEGNHGTTRFYQKSRTK